MKGSEIDIGTGGQALYALTKRADRMADFLSGHVLPENIWCGVTVENQKHGIPRIKDLQQVQASVLFISMEPLLEDLGELKMDRINWVIVGGESGPKARLMKQEWVNHIKAQSDQHRIPFFFKQWGGWGADGVKRNKKENGRIFLGKTWSAMPELCPA